MAREIHVGYKCEEPGFTMITLSADDFILINIDNPSLYNGVLESFCMYINQNGGGTLRFGTWFLSSGTYYIHSLASIITIPSGSNVIHVSQTGASVPISVDEFLGVCVHNNDSNNRMSIDYDSSSFFTNDRRANQTCTSASSTTDLLGKTLMTGAGVETGGGGPGQPNDTCQGTGILSIGEMNPAGRFGEITPQNFDCVSPPYTVQVTLKYPWGGSNFTDFIDENQKKIYTKPSSTPTEHWSVECTNIFCSGAASTAEFTECWWRESDVYYIKKSTASYPSSDNNFGTSWDVPFATITKGASTVEDPGILYIGYGKYTTETDISAYNIGPDPIYYTLTTPPGGSEWKELEITTSEDTYTDSRYPTTNYSTDNYVKVIGKNSASVANGYLKFDLSTIEDEHVSKVLFFFNVAAKDDDTIYISRVTGSWSASTLVWNTNPAVDTTPTETKYVDATGDYTVDITDIYEEETSSTLSLRVHSLYPGTVTTGDTWLSSLNLGGGGVPKLHVYYDNMVKITL